MKASSLFYAVIIALLLAMVSSSLILYSYYNKIYFSQYQIDHKLRINAGSGIRLLMEDRSIILSDARIYTDLYDEGNDSVFLLKKNWGIMPVCITSAFKQKYHYTLVAGAGIQKSNHIAFYLENHHHPLYVSGNTVIKGECFLPATGIKRAYIDGKGFEGDPIRGKINKSEEKLPPLKDGLTNEIEQLFQIDGDADSLIGEDEIIGRDTFVNSFLNNTITIYSKDTIILQGKKMTGNIRIVAAKRIIVENDTELADVILVAPVIEIDEHTKGVLQAYASDSLIIGKECSFNYPSVLALFRRDGSVKRMAMLVNEGSEIKGAVIGINKGPDDQILYIGIRPEVKIKGVVYSNNYLDLKGEVEGSVWCSKVILITPAAIYENHVLDLKINATDLDKKFVYPWLFESSLGKNKAVMKWLR